MTNASEGAETSASTTAEGDNSSNSNGAAGAEPHLVKEVEEERAPMVKRPSLLSRYVAFAGLGWGAAIQAA